VKVVFTGSLKDRPVLIANNAFIVLILGFSPFGCNSFFLNGCIFAETFQLIDKKASHGNNQS